MNSELRKRLGLQSGIFLLAVAAASHAASGINSSDSSSKPDASATVTLPFSVTNSGSQPITDLKPSDLAIIDNNHLASGIAALNRGSELPLRLGVLIDASGSQARSTLYKPEVQAMAKLLNEVLKGPEDRVFVINFSENPEGQATPFMSFEQFSKYKVHLNPQGGTALYEAIVFACNARMEKDNLQAARRVIIVVSDGDDNASRMTYEQTIDMVLRARVAIYAVSTGDDSQKMSSSERGNARLTQFANETGGKAFIHLRPKDIDKTFSTLRTDIENTYAVSFEPPHESGKGLHRIELKSSRKEKVQFRAPKGYYLK